VADTPHVLSLGTLAGWARLLMVPRWLGPAGLLGMGPAPPHPLRPPTHPHPPTTQ
jgi:hypothetical protein